MCAHVMHKYMRVKMLIWELSFSFDEIIILLSRDVSKMDISITLEKR